MKTEERLATGLRVEEMRKRCTEFQSEFFADRALIIAANRGPVTFYVRDFPISIDVEALREPATSEEISECWSEIQEFVGDLVPILTVDRIEPSRNIFRGFWAFDKMLELYPKHHDEMKLLALLVPSRMDVGQYQDYLDELMAAAGQVNAKHGDSDWEPIRMLVGNNYPRAMAGCSPTTFCWSIPSPMG